MAAVSAERTIVLVGGGHAHAQVIKALHSYARPAHVKVVLVDPQAKASYSGMVPGCVAGLYTHAETQLALVPLAAWASIDFKCTSVEDIDPEKRTLTCADGSQITYDALSLDIGSTTRGVGWWEDEEILARARAPYDLEAAKEAAQEGEREEL